jgi:hypothetical protein
MTAFNLQDSYSYSLTVQEIVIEMIDYDEPALDLYYQDVLDLRVREFQKRYQSAADLGAVPNELLADLDRAKRDVQDAIRFHRELHIAAQDISQGIVHPTLRLCKESDAQGYVEFTIDSAYRWAKSHGKDVPEWTLPTIQSSEAPQQMEDIAISWNGAELKLRAANKIIIKYADGRSVTKDLEGTGILNARTKKLNTAGVALSRLASNASIPKSGGPKAGISTKVMSELRSSLKELAGIDSDPFFDYNPADGWKPRFQFRDRRNAADERTKEKAGHDSYQDGLHGSSSFDEYTFDDELDDAASEFIDSHHNR